MWLYVLAVLAALAVILAIVVAMQPTAFSITRSARMAAPASEAFAQVNDFRNWGNWSPWEPLDPNLKRTYGSTTAGSGATYAWQGNKQVGEGRMTIEESRPHERVRIKLEFLKPFQATNEALFTFQPDRDGTNVTWTMTGDRNFMFKAMGLLMSMDKMIGKQFEQGLASMRATVEGAAVT